MLVLASIAAEKPQSFPEFDSKHTITLRPGQSVILAAGQKANAPYGTTVVQPGAGGQVIQINGQKNMVDAGPGVIVSVPVDAGGPADNIIRVR